MAYKLPTFIQFITENFGDDHDFSSLKPHHEYRTKDGHKVHVHIFNNPNGKHAVFYNHNLGVVTKLVHWAHGHETPSKQDLENAGKGRIEGDTLTEGYEKLSPDTAGKIAEHHTAIALMNHMHGQNGTFGSKQHKADMAPHHAAVKALAEGHDPDQVAIRKEHGEAMANAALEHLKLKHGPHVKITKVGHTSQKGDIEKFTNGKHKDTQENPSDVSVEVKNSDKSDDKNEAHYEGYSCKSSGKSNKITAKNPAIHLHGMLDHSTRKLNTEEVSRKAIQKVADKMGHGDKSAAERGRMIDNARKIEGVKKDHPDPTKRQTTIETEANKHGREAKASVAKEFHDHLHHLIHNTGPEGHHMIGKMLDNHLTAGTSMPWQKVHAQGEKSGKVKASITEGSESNMRKIFSNKKTRYAVTRSGERTTIHKVEKDGSHTAIAHYSPKTKSNVFKEKVHGWNVLPASAH